GQAAVSVGIDRSRVPDSVRDEIASVGKYSVIIGNREVAQFAPDEATVLVLPALQNYVIQVQPEQAPPYAVDLTRREVPLYPGNVVDLRFEAQFSVTIFGRLVDAKAAPIANARVSAGTDTVVTDDSGFFLITAPLGSALRSYNATGAACPEITIDEQLIGELSTNLGAYSRVGDIVCAL
ncbi:MAG: CS1-pili formation C-terminal domain-containing protein, partial [Chloroflexus sp.]